MARKKRQNILIAGLGNGLLKDDGVGVHAVRMLLEDPPPNVQVVEVGTAVLDALHLFEWADKILAIDAMQAGGAPGTIYSFGLADVEDRGVQTSLHELSLTSAFRFIPGHPIPEIKILGVEPAVIDYDLELSEPVQSALPRLLEAARGIVESWAEDADKLATILQPQEC